MKIKGLTIPDLPPELGNRLGLYAQLIRFEKPVGFYLLLWPTLWALAVAGEGSPDGWILFVFVVGSFLMRSAGCAINDYADRDIDLHVARTRERPLTSGKIVTARGARGVRSPGPDRLSAGVKPESFYHNAFLWGAYCLPRAILS